MDLKGEVKISDHVIGLSHPCFIIAEIGINHNGNLNTALELVEAAAAAGANCVKFQAFKAKNFCSGRDDELEYRTQGETVVESMLELFTRHELDKDQFRTIFNHAAKLGVVPLATPCDFQSVDMLDDLGAAAFKIGSDDIVYHDLLIYAAQKQKPLIISTGMANEMEIKQAIEVISSTGNDEIILLHCVSLYPTPADQLNLSKISNLRHMFDFPIGFSDHSEGITAALGARALGATVIEKHFTLDRTMKGPDHWFSSDPKEMRTLISEIHFLEKGFGSDTLEPTPGEINMRQLARRSIVAAHDLNKDHVIIASDLAYLRPGTGMMPYDKDKVIGKKIRAAVAEGTQLSSDLLS